MRRFRHVEGLMERNPDAVVVDVGCADGVFTKVIYDAVGARHITGIDVLPASIAWASTHWSNVPGMSFTVGDAHELPFPDASADAVTCLEMLEHVFDPVRVLREIFRVLKPGGYAVLLVPADTPLFLCIWELWQRWKGKIWNDTHIQSFRRGRLGRLAAEQGYAIDTESTLILGMLYSVKIRRPAVSLPDRRAEVLEIDKPEFARAEVAAL